MTLKIIKIISTIEQYKLREYLDNYQNLFESDISNYAKGRRRYWLEAEANLTKR